MHESEGTVAIAYTLCTCTRTHVIDAHARASTHSGSLAHAHALTCKCVCTNAKTWTRAHKVTRSHTHARTLTHMQARTHARVHKHARAHDCTHKHAQSRRKVRRPSRTHAWTQHTRACLVLTASQCTSGRYAEWHAACVEADMAERRNEWRLVEANAYATQPVRARLVVRLLAWFACMCVSDQCELLARERGGFEFAWVRVWTLRALAHDRCTCDCCAQVLRGRHRSQYNTFAACRKGPYRCLPLFRTLINAH
jgi:hypothetical protein